MKKSKVAKSVVSIVLALSILFSGCTGRKKENSSNAYKNMKGVIAESDGLEQFMALKELFDDVPTRLLNVDFDRLFYLMEIKELMINNDVNFYTDSSTGEYFELETLNNMLLYFNQSVASAIIGDILDTDYSDKEITSLYYKFTDTSNDSIYGGMTPLERIKDYFPGLSDKEAETLLDAFNLYNGSNNLEELLNEAYDLIKSGCIKGTDEFIIEVEYVVKEGDTLSEIATKYGTTVEDIVKKNKIVDINKIYPGTKLVIDKKFSISKVESKVYSL